jgi:hypothetical protein
MFAVQYGIIFAKRKFDYRPGEPRTMRCRGVGVAPTAKQISDVAKGAGPPVRRCTYPLHRILSMLSL